MIFKILLTGLTIWVISINPSLGQSLEIFQKSIKEARNGQYTSVDFRQFSNSSDISESITLLASFRNDSVESVRNRVYKILGRLEPYINEDADRKRSVELLTTGINDPSSGIVGSILDYLKDYKADDFNQTASQNLYNAVQNGTTHYVKLIKVAGFVNMDNLSDQLINVAKSDSLSAQIKWSVKLAQARIGDTDAIDFVMNRIRRYTVNDKFMYRILPTVLYTKNRRVAKLLSEIILDDSKNCQSADMEQDETIICGYQAMEYMARIVENFPVPADSEGYLETDDYIQALQTTRDWLKTNPEFVIDKTKY